MADHITDCQADCSLTRGCICVDSKVAINLDVVRIVRHSRHPQAWRLFCGENRLVNQVSEGVHSQTFSYGKWELQRMVAKTFR